MATPKAVRPTGKRGGDSVAPKNNTGLHRTKPRKNFQRGGAKKTQRRQRQRIRANVKKAIAEEAQMVGTEDDDREAASEVTLSAIDASHAPSSHQGYAEPTSMDDQTSSPQSELSAAENAHLDEHPAQHAADEATTPNAPHNAAATGGADSTSEPKTQQQTSESNDDDDARNIDDDDARNIDDDARNIDDDDARNIDTTGGRADERADNSLDVPPWSPQADSDENVLDEQQRRSRDTAGWEEGSRSGNTDGKTLAGAAPGATAALTGFCSWAVKAVGPACGVGIGVGILVSLVALVVITVLRARRDVSRLEQLQRNVLIGPEPSLSPETSSGGNNAATNAKHGSDVSANVIDVNMAQDRDHADNNQTRLSRSRRRDTITPPPQRRR